MFPKKEGFYWARWLVKCAGTADINDPPNDEEWEVMHVVRNSIEENDFVVMVPGVEQSQPIENFVWGVEVKRNDGWIVIPCVDEFRIQYNKKEETVAAISIDSDGVSVAFFDLKKKQFYPTPYDPVTETEKFMKYLTEHIKK